MFLIEKSSSSRGEVVPIAEERRDLLLGAIGRLGRDRLDVDLPLEIVVHAPLNLGRERRIRNERCVVEVLPLARLPLRGRHADHGERNLSDTDRLTDGVGVHAEELLDHGLAEDDDLGLGIHVLLRDADSRGHRPVANVEVLRRGPRDARRPVGLFADERLRRAQHRRRGSHARHLASDRREIIVGQSRHRAVAAAHTARYGRARLNDE
jgi:hypothetical protein